MNVLLAFPFRGTISELFGVKLRPAGVSYFGASLKAAGHLDWG